MVSGWWGDGAPPWERWPGATIETPMEYSEEWGFWISTCGEWFYDQAAADRAVEFFPDMLTHVKGPLGGEPFHLLPWQELLVVRPLFGFKHVETGLRRFRSLYLEVPRKNGKTALAAGLGLFALVADGESGPRVYSAAGNRDQARLVYRDSSELAEESRALDGVIEVFKTAIVCTENHGSYQAVSSVARTKQGLNPSCVIVDELHVHQSRDLYDALVRGTSARTQPLVLVITTAGDDKESLCWEEHEYSIDVIEGRVDDPQRLPVVFRIPDGANYRDESVWHLANPSLGTAKQVDYLRQQVAEAEAKPRQLPHLLRYEFNVWIETSAPWMEMAALDACPQVPELPDDLGELIACVGLDLSTTTDLASLAMAFRRPLDDVLEVDVGEESEPILELIDYEVELVMWHFMPRETLKRRVDEDRVPYDAWEREGWLTVTDGSAVDYRAIYRVLAHELPKRGWQAQSVGYDPAGATHLATQLDAAGLPMVGVRQGSLSLSPPMKLLEALIRTKRLHWRGDPVFRRAVSQTVAKEDVNRNIRPVKARSRSRIDPVVAVIIAIERLMVTQGPETSVYERRDPLEL